MGKKIAMHFMDELSAAGLSGLPMGWCEDGTLSLDQLTDDQRSAVLAVYEAHNPDNPPRIRSKILSELAALDALGIARALEDVAGVLTAAQVASLPSITRERLAMKAALRAELSTFF